MTLDPAYLAAWACGPASFERHLKERDMGLRGTFDPGTAIISPAKRPAPNGSSGRLAELLPYPLTVVVWGLVVKSEANLREHWAARHKRFKGQKEALSTELVTCRVLFAMIGLELARHGGRIRVTFTRVGTRRLDTDNLAGAFKACRDQLADMLGVDDGSDRVVWEYDQEAGKPAVVVTVEAVG